jgi:Holliday junction resolvasome RuvABC DNA-binding subunit
MKINNSDLKEVLKNHGIDENNQESIIEQLETREVIAETKESKDNDQAAAEDKKTKNSAELAAELGYKRKQEAVD